MSNVSLTSTDELCRALYEDAGLNATFGICCPPSFDGYRNWSVYLPNTIASQKCPKRIKDQIYNDKENITRHCLSNGVWAKKSNYDRCIFPDQVTYYAIATWFTGYTVSMIAVCIALFLLLYFRALRCLRNDIHCNLIVSYIVRVFTWYLITVPQLTTSEWPIAAVNITTIILLFSQLANYFWMFVEGLYLFTIIVWTYDVDKFKIWHYSIIGWGIPFVLSSIAAIAIATTISPTENWFINSKTNSIKLYIVHIPILFSIIVNVFVMAVIIYTLFKKLKQTKIPVTRRSSKLALLSTEYRKAIRAAAVLIPLLGIAHCIVMFEPKELKFSPAYKIFNALVTSTQGFFVALIYCFLNREVKFVIKAKYRSFRGYLPSTSRTRQTLDDSIGPVRRGNSAFRPYKQENDDNVFKCRSYRSSKSNNGNTSQKPESVIKEPNIEDQEQINC